MTKILARHLERRASIYVRQSSMAQVEHHKESGQRQYNLQERAVRLGWRTDQVEVIDEDQGQSGASAQGRSGFQRLVSDVALGEVGAVFGLEVSRLARSCADWYRLLEVAALAQTLIVDEDGVYDPNQYNDRLLLGLKGTLSEAELHFLKSRMAGGRRNKARRGEFRIRLPAGYVWSEDEIQMDPDERVRDAVHLFFRTFKRLGSASRVARFFEDNRQLFPRRDGWGSLSVAVTWGPLSVSRAVMVLHSPIYAGIYAYARNAAREEDPEEPGTGGRILIPESHVAYVSEAQYEANRARLAVNRNRYGWAQAKGVPRDGPSLLQGIVLCGRCGRRMRIAYPSSGVPSYRCQDSRTRRSCQSVNGRHVEGLLEEIVLEALSRAELELAVQAVGKLADRAEDLEAQWHKRTEAARYEVAKAGRRYHQVEPENRLVARTLEREWNDRLEDLERLEREHEDVRRRPPFELTDEQRQRIMALATDVPRLWRAPTTRPSQRKQIVRLLMEDVTLHNVDVPWGIEVAVRWRTGMVSRHQAERPRSHSWTTRPEAMGRIRELFADKEDKEIAEILNTEGHRTGRNFPFTADRVASLRLRRGMTRARRTPSSALERMRELAPEHSDAEIAKILNGEGMMTATGLMFTERKILQIRHRHGIRKRPSRKRRQQTRPG